jgi:hypothetical protein
MPTEMESSGKKKGKKIWQSSGACANQKSDKRKPPGRNEAAAPFGSELAVFQL